VHGRESKKPPAPESRDASLDEAYRAHRKAHYLTVLRTAMQREAEKTGSEAHPGSELTPDQIRNNREAATTLREMLGSPLASNRLYAALLLEEIDPSAARRALEDMQQDPTPVLVPFGNVLTPRAVSELVADLLADRDMCFVPPMRG
jgi:hypothetical protein